MRRKERVRHRPPDDDLIDDWQYVANQRHLVANLGATEDQHEGLRRLDEGAAESLHLALQQLPGHGLGHDPCYSHYGRMSPVRDAEGIADIRIGELRQFCREAEVVAGFAGVVAQVLEKQNLTLSQFLHELANVRADAVGREGDRLSEQLAQPRGDRRHAEPSVRRAARTTPMGHQDHARAAADQVPNRRQGRCNPIVIGHHAVCHRDVEVDAHEHAPTLDRHVLKSQLAR